MSGDERSVTIHLTEQEADALYFYVQSDDCPNYWESPLEPVGTAITRYWREMGGAGWSSR